MCEDDLQLQTPLLGQEEQHQEKDGENHYVRAVSMSSTLLAVGMFFQFMQRIQSYNQGAATFRVPLGVDGEVVTSPVIAGIVVAMFFVTLWMYRVLCRKANLKTYALILLPELFVDAMIVLNVFNQVGLAVLVLLASIGFYTLVGGFVLLELLLVRREQTTEAYNVARETYLPVCPVV